MRHAHAAVAVALSVLFLLTPAVYGENTQLLMQLFYESKCPYSIAFINDQLPTAYEDVGPDFLRIQFVPYGKASTIASGDGYVFRCQHGSEECYGNKLQACGLARLSQSNVYQYNFIYCVMNSTNTTDPSEDCATDVGLSLEELKTCASGLEGEMLLASYGEITPSTLIYESGVPLILFNEESTYENEDVIQDDLVDFICEKFEDNGGSVPPGCNA